MAAVLTTPHLNLHDFHFPPPPDYSSHYYLDYPLPTPTHCFTPPGMDDRHLVDAMSAMQHRMSESPDGSDQQSTTPGDQQAQGVSSTGFRR